MHRIGGIEKQDGTGNISYDPANHELMVRLREERILKIADKLPPLEVMGDDDADILVVGWGSTWGAITSAVGRLEWRHQGRQRASAAPLPVRPEPGRTLAEVRPRRRAGDEPRTAHEAAPSRVSRRCQDHLEGVGQPFTAAELVTKIQEVAR